jgi:succinate dehydrogenase / fumarate reductase, membrane anchor subunit
VSAKLGGATRHWRNQRVTSIALLPLAPWFLLSLLRQPALDYATVAAWLGRPGQALLAALLGAAMLWHSLQGVEVVLEDYVRGRALAISLRVSQLLHAAAAVALAAALIAIVRGGAA